MSRYLQTHKTANKPPKQELANPRSHSLSDSALPPHLLLRLHHHRRLAETLPAREVSLRSAAAKTRSIWKSLLDEANWPWLQPRWEAERGLNPMLAARAIAEAQAFLDGAAQECGALSSLFPDHIPGPGPRPSRHGQSQDHNHNHNHNHDNGNGHGPRDEHSPSASPTTQPQTFLEPLSLQIYLSHRSARIQLALDEITAFRLLANPRPPPPPPPPPPASRHDHQQQQQQLPPQPQPQPQPHHRLVHRRARAWLRARSASASRPRREHHWLRGALGLERARERDAHRWAARLRAEVLRGERGADGWPAQGWIDAYRWMRHGRTRAAARGVGFESCWPAGWSSGPSGLRQGWSCR